MQVSQRLIELPGYRPAVIDVKRAAVDQYRMKRGVAAHGVIPRHPVEHGRDRPVRIARPHLHHHRGIGAHHLLRVDDGLGHPGGAGGEQQFSNGIGRDRGDRLPYIACHRRCREIGEGDALDARAGTRDMDDGNAVEIKRLQRLLEGRAVLHHHHPGLDQVEQIFQLQMILAHQRIGRGYRGRRKPRLHRSLRQQRMLDRIAGEDRDRTARLELQIEQALRQPVDDLLSFAVGDFSPLPVAAGALRQPDTARRFGGPFRQRRRNMALVRLQRNPRLQNDDAVGPPLDRDVARQPFDLAKGGLRHNRGGVSTHYCVSRN